jgi:anti-anti-sigma factor
MRITRLKNFLRFRRQESLPFLKEIETLKNLRIIRLQGAVDMTTLPNIERIKTRAKAQRGLMEKNILLDLRHVTHVDSSTIASLLVALSEIKKEKHTLALVNIPPTLKNILDIGEYRKLVPVYANEARARSALNRSSKRPSPRRKTTKR